MIKFILKRLGVAIPTILILIMPILPHFASECLIMLNPKLSLENISWPVYDKALMEDSDCNIVIQINGKN